MAVGALAIGALSAWMLWMVNKLLDGNTLYDWVVGLVLDEVILAAGFFAVLLFVWALFTPAWLTRLINAAYHKLTRSLAWLGILFAASVLFMILVLPLVLKLAEMVR